MAFGDVHTFGPTFRAEVSYTQRHAAEFWMIEPEMAFADLNDYMDTAEAMVKYIINRTMERCPQEMEFFNAFVDKGLLERLHNVVSNDFGRVTYTEAVEIFKNSGRKFEYPVEWGIDLQTEHERYLTEEVFKKPIFVTDYPKDIKGLSHAHERRRQDRRCGGLPRPRHRRDHRGGKRPRENTRKKHRGGGGGPRGEEHWHLPAPGPGGAQPPRRLRPRSFERMVMYLTGVSNIRDGSSTPRTTGNADFLIKHFSVSRMLKASGKFL